ncbi:hypothetical protein BX600DRAFT_431795 [Xylariales sp. PMI_506]|nr:hypothetical protein BX600DRAFT_431795 [Xylariales sp. PMI_506]
MDGILVGIIQVPVQHLRFREDLAAREFDKRISDYLVPQIKHDLRDADPRNRVEGIVDDERLGLILDDLRLSYAELYHTISTNQYPHLPNRIVEYIHGQHRIEAAKAFEFDCTWTVELRWYQGLSRDYLSKVVHIKDRADQFAHETRFSDGDIYRAIKDSEDVMDSARIRKWANRLTDGKNKSRGSIDRRDNLTGILDRLRPMQGLWSGKMLGNWGHYFALHCDVMICRYLQERMYTCLSRITCGGRYQGSIDLTTVRFLEGRAPSASQYDYELIRKAFDSGQLFSRISDAGHRSAIRRNLLELDVLIPSFRTFHENMKYFSIAARIMKNLLFPNEGDARRKSSDPNFSLLEALHNCWEAPSVPLVELSDGVFQPLLGVASFEIMYCQLFLIILREFPFMDRHFTTRVDHGEQIEAGIRPDRKYLFYLRAKLLGFRNQQVEEGIAREISPYTPIFEYIPSETLTLISKTRRWGRPHTRTFRVIQQIAYLPQLVAHPPKSIYPSVLFIFRDFFHAFFGSYPFALDYQKPAFNLYHNVCVLPNQQRWLLPSIPEQQEDVHMEDREDPEDVRMKETEECPSIQFETEDAFMEGGQDRSRPQPTPQTDLRVTTPASPTRQYVSGVEIDILSTGPTTPISPVHTQYSPTHPSFSTIPAPEATPTTSRTLDLSQIPSFISSSGPDMQYWKSGFTDLSRYSSHYVPPSTSTANSLHFPGASNEYKPLNPYQTTGDEWYDIRLTPQTGRSMASRLNAVHTPSLRNGSPPWPWPAAADTFRTASVSSSSRIDNSHETAAQCTAPISAIYTPDSSLHLDSPGHSYNQYRRSLHESERQLSATSDESLHKYQSTSIPPSSLANSFQNMHSTPVHSYSIAETPHSTMPWAYSPKPTLWASNADRKPSLPQALAGRQGFDDSDDEWI